MVATGNSGTKRTVITLPTEIITDEIFSKLPVKSLLRFKCVSKTFNNIISSSEFINLQLRQSLSSDVNRLLINTGTNNCLSSINVYTPDSSIVPVEIPLPRCGNRAHYIVGLCNGLLCLGPSSDQCNSVDLVLINPSTRVYRVIPHHKLPVSRDYIRVSFGFGLDEINLDYKFVRVLENISVDYEVLDATEVMVYSLKEDSWKLIEEVEGPSDSMIGSPKCVLTKNHLLHWAFSCKNRLRIRCFDVRFDKWVNDVPLMDLSPHFVTKVDEKDDNKVVINSLHLGVLHGCFCVSADTKLCHDVWIMKEYGVKESWVKLLDVSRLLGYSGFHFSGPFCFRQGSKHEVLVRSWKHNYLSDDDDGSEYMSQMYWFDIRSGVEGRMEEIKDSPIFNEAWFLKESLVPIPGGKRIQ